jgi:hypothetical protein
MEKQRLDGTELTISRARLGTMTFGVNETGTAWWLSTCIGLHASDFVHSDDFEYADKRPR